MRPVGLTDFEQESFRTSSLAMLKRSLFGILPAAACVIAARKSRSPADCAALSVDPIENAELKLVQVVFRYGNYITFAVPTQ